MTLDSRLRGNDGLSPHPIQLRQRLKGFGLQLAHNSGQRLNFVGEGHGLADR